MACCWQGQEKEYKRYQGDPPRPDQDFLQAEGLNSISVLLKHKACDKD